MNTSAPAHGLTDLSQLDAASIEAWLERALRGRERLPLATPDEHPFLAIARHESSLDEIRRKDLRSALGALVARYASEGDGDDEYVTSLLGLAEELDLLDAKLPLSQLALDEGRFDALPLRQQAKVLGTLIDMHVVLDDARWTAWARSDRHQALALTALLSKGLDGLGLLRTLDVDENVADSLFLVLSEHWRSLGLADRQQMSDRGRQLLENCSGAVRSAVQDWLSETGESVQIEQRVASQAVNFLAAFNRRHPAANLRHCARPARLAM